MAPPCIHLATPAARPPDVHTSTPLIIHFACFRIPKQVKRQFQLTNSKVAIEQLIMHAKITDHSILSLEMRQVFSKTC